LVIVYHSLLGLHEADAGRLASRLDTVGRHRLLELFVSSKSTTQCSLNMWYTYADGCRPQLARCPSCCGSQLHHTARLRSASL
jgi:hypothetical protein